VGKTYATVTWAGLGAGVASGQAEVLDVVNGFVEQGCDVVVVEPVNNAASADKSVTERRDCRSRVRMSKRAGDANACNVSAMRTAAA
jgi:hypothetical protein